MAKVTHKSEKADREVSPNASVYVVETFGPEVMKEDMDGGRVGQMRDKLEHMYT